MRPTHPTWNRSSGFSLRPSNFLMTLSTKRRFPWISFSRASWLPALACRKSSLASSRLSTGSLAVLTPLISTLPRRPMVILPPLSLCWFQYLRGKSPSYRGGQGFFFIVPLPSMDFSGFPLGKGAGKGKKSLQFGGGYGKILTDSVRGSDKRPCAWHQVGRADEGPGGTN